MNVRALRRLTTITVLTLASVATVAACSSAGPSRPDQTPSTTPSTAAASAPTRPTADPTRPATGPPCLGAVTYTLSATDTGKPWPKNLCITVGGVLWVKNLGPQGMSMSPPGKVDCWYEAAVHNCRLIHTGTVKVTITGHQTRQLTLVIADAASPPLPAPACLRTGTVYRVDANDGGPPWMAMCMKLGAVLRFENLGPGRLSANPQSAVSTQYEAGVHTVRFVKAATVTFTVTAPHETRPLIVVAVK